jgi:hypothetical protein
MIRSHIRESVKELNQARRTTEPLPITGHQVCRAAATKLPSHFVSTRGPCIYMFIKQNQHANPHTRISLTHGINDNRWDKNSSLQFDPLIIYHKKHLPLFIFNLLGKTLPLMAFQHYCVVVCLLLRGPSVFRLTNLQPVGFTAGM